VDNGNSTAAAGRRYRWPWFLLAAVVLAIFLVLVWLLPVIRSIREQRQANPPSTSSEPGNTNPGH
jgi:hypothetical protein